MTDRDKAILRAVQTLSDNANAVRLRQALGVSIPDVERLYSEIYLLEFDKYIYSWFPPVDPQEGGRNFRHWCLTRLGEAAIADEGQGRDEAECTK